MEKELMQDLRKQEDERSREHWAFVESVANKVGNWPLWKQAATLTASQLTVVQESHQEADVRRPVGGAYAAD
jgi:hypothetical protein